MVNKNIFLDERKYDEKLTLDDILHGSNALIILYFMRKQSFSKEKEKQERYKELLKLYHSNKTMTN